MFSVFHSSYRNTCESLGERKKKQWKHWPVVAHVPPTLLNLPNFYLCFYNNRNAVHVFYSGLQVEDNWGADNWGAS